MDAIETRAWRQCRIEPIDNRRLRGHAIVFNVQSEDLGGFKEIIAPEAVDRTFREAIDVRALVDHEPAKIIGRLRAGTLELQKDGTGLRSTVEPDPEISYARDIMAAVRRGDVSGQSFAFRTIEDTWNWEDPQMPIRTVQDMRVREVSIVTFPAYTQTDVSVAQRSLVASLDEYRRLHPTMGRSLALLQRWHRQRLVS